MSGPQHGSTCSSCPHCISVASRATLGSQANKSVSEILLQRIFVSHQDGVRDSHLMLLLSGYVEQLASDRSSSRQAMSQWQGSTPDTTLIISEDKAQLIISEDKAQR
jgi:hypothetical protein